jgi:hypothetical protein
MRILLPFGSYEGSRMMRSTTAMSPRLASAETMGGWREVRGVDVPRKGSRYKTVLIERKRDYFRAGTLNSAADRRQVVPTGCGKPIFVPRPGSDSLQRYKRFQRLRKYLRQKYFTTKRNI